MRVALSGHGGLAAHIKVVVQILPPPRDAPRRHFALIVWTPRAPNRAGGPRDAYDAHFSYYESRAAAYQAAELLDEIHSVVDADPPRVRDGFEWRRTDAAIRQARRDKAQQWQELDPMMDPTRLLGVGQRSPRKAPE
jgi:hypothetical protein